MRLGWLILIGLLLLPACSGFNLPDRTTNSPPSSSSGTPNPAPTLTTSATSQAPRQAPVCAAFGDTRALSPDGRTQAYIVEGTPPVLVLRDTATNTERQLPLEASEPDTQAGSIAWSPDSAVLVLTTAIHPCDAQHWLHSVIRVDVGATLKQRVIISNRPRYLRTLRWQTPTTVALEDGPGNIVLMDPYTGGSPTR